MNPEIQLIIDRALSEDLQGGDVTTRALIPNDFPGVASFISEEPGILSGLGISMAVFTNVDPSLKVDVFIEESESVSRGDVLGKVTGSMVNILSAERTALNFVRKLSGIATETQKFVKAVTPYGTRILDTRKTTPGLRLLEKRAVLAGGGQNHRYNLSDGILIKDNHIEALRISGLDISEVVTKARTNAPHTLKIEIEVEDLTQVSDALDAGVDVLLLDNMDLSDMRKAVEMCRGRALTEASGRVSIETVSQIAQTGVDMISVGALTHSSKALDIGLEICV
ncbi:MAG: carboxylating nicotinate-nucleotide diphosphorylase [Chloroflexota bacterium]|nr:carboxylating nicotinate-nucleotide diphosphorylase [Chloroflexota bacterium]